MTPSYQDQVKAFMEAQGFKYIVPKYTPSSQSWRNEDGYSFTDIEAAFMYNLTLEARKDELQQVVDGKATLSDIYGDDPRNNYGYNETQVRDAANWLRHKHCKRVAELDRLLEEGKQG